MIFGKTKQSSKHTKPTNSDSMEKEQSLSIGGAVSSLAKGTAKQTVDSFKDIGSGLFQQLLNSESIKEKYPDARKSIEKEQKAAMNLEHGTIFSFRNIEEERQIEDIKQLIEAIRKEVEGIKRADSTLMQEVSDIQKMTIDTLPERPGIYHVRFLEIVLKILQSLRLKIGESNTWMTALKSKKAKRGSAFAANSKKKGTQYSMSQEHQASRNVQ